MYLDNFSQEYLVDSLEELEILLRKRFLEEVNFFILTFKENGFLSYPLLSKGISVLFTIWIKRYNILAKEILKKV